MIGEKIMACNRRGIGGSGKDVYDLFLWSKRPFDDGLVRRLAVLKAWTDRRSKRRFEPEQIAGECKWTAGQMSKQVLDDLRTYKIPAVAQEKNLKVPAAGPEILLFARSGFEKGLRDEAAADERITLVDLDTLVRCLDSESR
jgi:hypothetical protein